jgi:hypothetical protein
MAKKSRLQPYNHRPYYVEMVWPDTSPRSWFGAIVMAASHDDAETIAKEQFGSEWRVAHVIGTDPSGTWVVTGSVIPRRIPKKLG